MVTSRRRELRAGDAPESLACRLRATAKPASDNIVESGCGSGGVVRARWLLAGSGMIATAHACVGCFLMGETDTGEIVADGGASIEYLPGECGDVEPGVYAIPPTGTPASDSTVGSLVRDRSDGASVQCSVTEQADGVFVVDGTLEYEGSTFRVAGTLESVGTGAYSGQGTIEHSSPETGAHQSPAEACSLTVSPEQDIRADRPRVWASFTCPSMVTTDAGTATSGCPVAGSFAFEDCYP